MNEIKKEIMRINHPVSDPIYDAQKYEEYEILDFQKSSSQQMTNIMKEGLEDIIDTSISDHITLISNYEYEGGEEVEDADDIDNIDFNNYKGIYADDDAG